MRKLLTLLIFLAIFCGIWLWVKYPDAPVIPPEEPKAPIIGAVDHILVEKSKRIMTVYQSGKAVREYPIALGFTPDSDKVKQGDGKTPEGLYKINRRNPQSSYTLSLGLNYPLPADLKRAREGNYDPGGDIFIHGQPNRLLDKLTLTGDWTAGCIAVSNEEMRELWDAVPIGTPIEIRP